MKDSTAREQLLKAVRKALINPSEPEPGIFEQDGEIYTPQEEDSMDLLFAKNFTGIKGNFLFCESIKNLPETLTNLVNDRKWSNIYCLEPPLQEILTNTGIKYNSSNTDFQNLDIGITACEFLIARTGSIMISSRQLSGRRLPVYANVHLTVAYTSQLVYNVKDALKMLRKKYETGFPSFISIISGPSQTADIEKTLVQGAHGPKEIFLILVDNTTS